MWLHELVQVGVLGPLRVRVGDREVTPRGQRQRDAFVALVQRRGRPVSADTLLELIWGARAAESSGPAAVHTAVARLRRTVGADGITRSEHGYQLDPAFSTDEDAFFDLRRRGRQLLADGDPAAACDTIRAALGTWRGERAFDDVRDDLVAPDRARLDEARVAVVEELATAILEHPSAGPPAEAFALAARLIDRDPLRERAHQLAMLASYRDQHQVRALQIFRDLRQRLRADLGIEPSPATSRLHAMILRQDPTLDPIASARRPGTTPLSGQLPDPPSRLRSGPLPGPPSSGAPATWPRVPAPVTPIVGRRAERQRVLRCLADGRRLVTLTGPPGVGKTRLLIEVGTSLDDPARVAFVGLGGLDGSVDGPALAGALAVALGVADPRRPPADALAVALAGTSCWLLLDEADRLGDPLPPLLGRLLADCPNLRVIVSSRSALAAPGEVLVVVEPLEVPPPEATPNQVIATDAVRLLVVRLDDLGVPVGGSADESDRLAAIARRTGGLPLALELLAGQVRTRSLADLASLAAAPLDVPAAVRSANPRHRTLRDAIRSSTDRLTPAQAALLRALSIFDGDVDRAAALAVAVPPDDPDRLLADLVRYALLQLQRPDNEMLRYRLLPTVRALVGQELVGAERDQVRARHRRWFADRWREVDDLRTDAPGGGADLIHDVHEHLDDYLGAGRSALADGDGAALAGVTGTLTRYWLATGAHQAGLDWTAAAIDSGLLDAIDTARIRVRRAALALHHRPNVVIPTVDAALPVVRSHGLVGTTLLAYLVRALELCSSGRGPMAVTDADAAVALARDRGAADRARAFSVLAIATALAGEPDRAGAATTAAWDLGAELDGPSRATVATNLAWSLLHQDRPYVAQDVLDEWAPGAGPATPNGLLLVRGWVLLESGRPAAALATFAAALPPGPPVIDRLSVETSLGAGCAMASLELPAAGAVLHDALTLARRVDLALLPVLARAVSAARPGLVADSGPDPGEPAEVAEVATRLRALITAATRPPAGPRPT